jgi:hypothetical protein
MTSTTEDTRDLAISPLYADLTGLPPAVYPDCVHGFTGFPMELAKRAGERIDAFMERALS